MVKTQFPKKNESFSAKHILSFSFALVFFFLLLTSVIGLANKYFSIRSRIRELKTEESTLQTKESSLKTTNEYLETPEGQEQLLRDKYNFVKPGEGIVVIVSDTPPAPEPKPGMVSRWWDAIIRGLGIKKD
jgi:cell division protein FtsB